MTQFTLKCTTVGCQLQVQHQDHNVKFLIWAITQEMGIHLDKLHGTLCPYVRKMIDPVLALTPISILFPTNAFPHTKHWGLLLILQICHSLQSLI